MRILIVVLALAATNCGTLGLTLFPRAPPGVDQEVVELYVCRGAELLADVYMEERGAPRAERLERIERARAKCHLREESS